MVFRVKEIKELGSGIGRSLSVRFQKEQDPNTEQSGEYRTPYTLHAVLPYSPEFGQLQIGKLFELTEVRMLGSWLPDVSELLERDQHGLHR